MILIPLKNSTHMTYYHPLSVCHTHTHTHTRVYMSYMSQNIQIKFSNLNLTTSAQTAIKDYYFMPAMRVQK